MLFRRYCGQNEKTSYGLEENIYKTYLIKNLYSKYKKNFLNATIMQQITQFENGQMI